MSYDEFRAAIAATGMEPPQRIEAGKFHRFPGIGKTGANTSGYCRLFADGLGGVYGDFASGISETWQAKRTHPFSAAEREAFNRRIGEAKAEADREREAQQAQAAARAQAICAGAFPAFESHPYVMRKNIPPSGALQNAAGDLVIPVNDGRGAITSVQTISPTGEKRFLPNGRVAGGFFAIGAPGGSVLICEGFATGASIYAATNSYAVCAFFSGNLKAVAELMRRRDPQAEIILCADDDARTPGNPGLTKAKEAAQAVGGKLAVPDFGDNRPDGATDFNDLAALRGPEAITRAIHNAVTATSDKTEVVASRVNAAMRGAESLVALTRGDQIKISPICWLWLGWLARAKLHIVAGKAGEGKSTITNYIAATCTVGGTFPDGRRAPLGNVVVITLEDDPADTWLPRFLAAGGDASRLHFVDAHFDADRKRMAFDPSDAEHVALLEHRIREIGDVVLLVIDPLVAAVAGDSHKNSETRRDLQPLVNLAASTHAALLGVHHFTKASAGRDPVERVSGSLAFAALARIVWVVGRDQNSDDGMRFLMRAKSNIGPDDGGFVYSLATSELAAHPGVVVSRIKWGEAIAGTARELLKIAEQPDDESSALDDAVDFLRSLLIDGPLPVKTIRADADGAGHSWRTIQRAQKVLNVAAVKEGMRGGWVWRLAKNAKNHEECHSQSLAAFGNFGALRDEKPEDGDGNETTKDAKNTEDRQEKKLATLGDFGALPHEEVENASDSADDERGVEL